MTIEVRPATWAADMAALMAIRRAVFIVEQQVPEALEWEAADHSARHWLAALDGEVAGTARLLPGGHIGRMAVLAAARGRGLGSALLTAAVAGARADGCLDAFLHAQVHALPFYARHGFVAEGPVFMDAGIPHRTMRLRLRD